MIIFWKIIKETKPCLSHHQSDGRTHRMITTTQQMGYQIHNTHQSYKTEKLGEPKANHIIPYEHTLRNLDRKLDKIHRDWAHVNWSQRWNESQQRPRPLTGRKPPYTNALTYELTPAAARVVFLILNPNCIQWLCEDQKIIIKTPRSGATRVAKSRRCWLVPKATQNFCTYLTFMSFRMTECTFTSRQHGNTVIY